MRRQNYNTVPLENKNNVWRPTLQPKLGGKNDSQQVVMNHEHTNPSNIIEIDVKYTYPQEFSLQFCQISPAGNPSMIVLIIKHQNSIDIYG